MIRKGLLKRWVELEVRLELVEERVRGLRSELEALVSMYRQPPPKPPPERKTGSL